MPLSTFHASVRASGGEAAGEGEMNKAALREVCSTAARVWSLSGSPKKFEHYTYVNNRWVLVTVEFNGEEAPPKRRAEDNRKPATMRPARLPGQADGTGRDRLEDLTSDRSIDA